VTAWVVALRESYGSGGEKLVLLLAVEGIHLAARMVDRIIAREDRAAASLLSYISRRQIRYQTAVGLGTAFRTSCLIGSLLYGISPRDPGVFAATTATLLAVALLACWLPARRAARLSPRDALRTD
jgi:hypothetical protein